MLADAPRLVLASASPRRSQLLAQVGVFPTVQPADVDETPMPDETPGEMVQRLALLKAETVADTLDPNVPALVLGSDTTVVLDGESLGKPVDDAEAALMLSRLQGRDHVVVSGVSLVLTGVSLVQMVMCEPKTVLETSTVSLRSIQPDEIEWYVKTGEPMGKAGAYAIQGYGSAFVTGVVGNYHNVVGLPLSALDEMLVHFGCRLRDFSALTGAPESAP